MYQLYSCDVTDLCNDRRGEQRSITYIDQTRLNMQFTFPLSEIATDFYDELKGRSSGYASFDYEDAGFRPADLGELFVHLLTLGYPCLSVAWIQNCELFCLVKLSLMLNGNTVEELSYVVHARQVWLYSFVNRYLTGERQDYIYFERTITFPCTFAAKTA